MLDKDMIFKGEFVTIEGLQGLVDELKNINVSVVQISGIIQMAEFQDAKLPKV